MKKLSIDAYIFILVIAVMLAVIAISLTMPYLASKMLPLMVSSIVLIAAAIGLRKELSASPKAAKASGKKDGTDKAGRLGYLIHGGWVVAFFTAIYLVGFLVSMPLFMLFYMKWLGARWRTSFIFAVLTPLIIWAIFERAIGLELYRGLFFS